VTAKVIPFPVDVAALLREDILAWLCTQQTPKGSEFSPGAELLARWLLRPEGAVKRLVGMSGAVHPGQQNLLDNQTSMFDGKEGA
jgi:hypothetical protein